MLSKRMDAEARRGYEPEMVDSAQSRTSNQQRVWLASLASFAVLSWLSIQGVDCVRGFLFAVGWVGALTALQHYCLRDDNVILAIMIFVFGLGYSSELGATVTHGTQRLGIHISAASGSWAAVQLAAFLAVVVLLATVCQRALDKRFPPQRLASRQARADDNRLVRWALWILLGITFYASLRTGFWTNYGGGRQLGRVRGGFRLELLYEPLVAVGFLHAAVPMRRESIRSRLGRMMTIAAPLAIAVLVFMVQQRRVMVVCAVAWMFMAASGAGHATKLRAGRLALSGLLVGALLVGAVFASATWRGHVSGERGAHRTKAIDRLTHTVTSAVSDDASFSKGRLAERFTYLWIDALAIEHRDHLVQLSLVDNLRREIAVATPALLYPGKFSVPQMSCEQVFARIGVRNRDLACSAPAEGQLSTGLGAVAFLALLWGAFLGLATWLVRRRSALLALLGLVLFLPWIDIETGAFPMIRSLRLALLCWLPIALISFVLSLTRFGRSGAVGVDQLGARAHSRHDGEDVPPQAVCGR